MLSPEIVEIVQILAATLVGLVMGFWAGAYIMRLWDDTNISWQKKFALGASTIAGMGGIPSAAFFAWIKDKAIWCLLLYMMTLVVPAFITYSSSILWRRRWTPPDPRRFER